ncbi:MAG: hypothetical protein JSS02_27165 [Planctomycetes bacterium]|nr:hypothetical protein [Planctomycetota bacterium]
MPALHIPDGYTRTAIIPSGATHPELEISYRPLLATERQRLARQTVRLCSHGPAGRDTAARLVASTLATRLVDWDLFDSQGRHVEITPATVATLPAALFERVYEHVARFADDEASAKN